MKLSHKPKTEIFIKEVSDAFLPLQIILLLNILCFEDNWVQINPFDFEELPN